MNDFSNFFVPVIGVATVCISFNQWISVRNKQRMDLFDRRVVVYKSVKTILATMKLRRELTDAMIQEYMAIVSCARWIFDKEIGFFCSETIVGYANEYQNYCDSSIYRRECEVDEKDVERFRSEVACIYNDVDDKFSTFMQLEKGGFESFEEMLKDVVLRIRCERRK